MKFVRMELNDFRQFYGLQAIEFATGKDNNVTLINGVNGAGKTNTLEAINWCFYGEYMKNRGAILSKEKASHAEFGTELECSVSIWYIHEGDEYVATRKGRAIKIKHDPIPTEIQGMDKYKGFTLRMLPSKEGDFFVRKRLESGMTEVNNPNLTIDHAFPINAKQYFLFDGEKIEQLSKPENDDDIRKAVRNILQLPTIKRATDHLKTLKNEFLIKLKRIAKNITEEDLVNKIDEIDKGIDAAKNAKTGYEAKLANVRELQGKIEQDLRKFSAVDELTKRQDDLKKAYQNCQLRRKNNKANIADILAKSSLILCGKIIEDTADLIEEKRPKISIPPGIRESFIKDLIEKGACICGNELKEGSEGKLQIEKFVRESKINIRVGEELSEIISDLSAIKRSYAELPTSLKNSLSNLISSIDELEDISGRLDDVQRQLERFGHTDIEKLAKSAGELKNEERLILKQISEIELAIDVFKNDKAEIEKVLKKITKEISASGELARLTDLAEMSIDVFQKVYEEFARKKRKEIEAKLNEVFYGLMWKKDQFPKVSLTENYSLQVFDKYGSPARAELSAGENQILSLSLITAMGFVIGGTLPLIMDTPFGKLFSEHRANIVTEVPNLTNQWVLLVQDEEVSEEILKILMPRVGKEYKLVFSDGCTTVEEV